MEKRRILVVEDIGLIAFDLAQMLEDAGAIVVGPAGDLASAVQLASSEVLDGALLDVDLLGERSFPVAEVLLGREIPFLFVTGEIDFSSWPKHLRNHPRLPKPAPARVLIAALQDLLGPARACVWTRSASGGMKPTQYSPASPDHHDPEDIPRSFFHLVEQPDVWNPGLDLALWGIRRRG